MKNYKINKITNSSKTWRYAGMTNDYNEIINEFERYKGKDGVTGLKITDVRTGKTIYSNEIKEV